MRITFDAREAAFVADFNALVCGVVGPDTAGVEHYLTLQRGREGEDPTEDGDVYLEFDDQIHSGYGHIGRAALSRAMFSIDLAQPLGQLDGVVGFDVRLVCDDAAYAQISAGLPRIFRGILERLEVR